MRALNNTIFFSATYEPAKNAVYKSDGTEAGTTVFYDMSNGDYSSFLYPYVYNDELYFYGNSANGGLIKTDGTTITTLADTNTGAAGDFVNGFIEYNGLLYFSADVGSFGTQELFKTDGSMVLNLQLKDNPPTSPILTCISQ